MCEMVSGCLQNHDPSYNNGIIVIVVESEVDTQLSNWLADWVNVLLLLLLLQVYRTKHDIYIPYICMYMEDNETSPNNTTQCSNSSLTWSV